MLIAAFQKLTLLDYPGKLAALIFTQGCNFFCDYCHNPEMVTPFRMLPYDPMLEPEHILSFLHHRQGKLDGVVISGGEPTLQPDLEDCIRSIKQLGFLVKLDTNGSHPEVLKQLLEKNLLDYVAMDIKYDSEGYRKYFPNIPFEAIEHSIALLKNSGIDYEFRSTMIPGRHTSEAVMAMGEMIRGAKQWHLQNFRPIRTLARGLNDQRGFFPDELTRLQHLARRFAEKVEVRDSALKMSSD